MPNESLQEDRQIVTCDGCGTPYAAVVDRNDVVLVGAGDGECPNCAGEEFSKLTL